ncbi:hypothetical protein NO559_10950 [Dasania sp. GY-MA-18]|uniref:Uncharacterized protein n=1 Tax=Dasania phycosphaerae TaxID=2950436 RepID=A0A9J6RLX9_9GAMM|nr:MULTISPECIES: hypothetical protein [Dasania]MCR8923294.1 hypothetical protein [Dasania sp. GY-MA-18]MCZ0865726.1 hypothetical protein [Dasania phycosphaerae]MCZ0869451.1 hypothetical protein [Dasania phycosphaerae]
MKQQQTLYDVYFTGKLVDEVTPEQAQQAVAKLFKTQPAKISHLFNGQTHVLKRGLDKESALKYKSALRKAGLSILFKMSADSATNPASQASRAAATPPPASSTASASSELSVAAVGSDVLAAHEKRQFVPADIDTSNIKLSSPFLENFDQATPPPPAPDTSHISVAEVGADISEPKHPAPPLALDIDDITLAPPGALLEELHEELPELNPDTSSISLAPAGADLLEGQTKPAAPAAPDTSHIKLANN